MPASSLIFVVIVAIWAAFLLQLWSRRRENAAAARSVDGFTEARRVLDERRSLPATGVAEPRPHSHSVTAARVVRSTADVGHAVPAAASRHSSPLVARRRFETDPAEVETMTPAPAGSDSRTARSTRPGSARSSRTTPASTTRPPRPVSRTRRRFRAALLLLSLLWVPTSVVLVFLRVLLWMSVPLSVLTLLVVLVWLRTEAQADRARASGVGRRAARRATTAEPAPALSSDDTQVIREPHRYAAAGQAGQVGQPATAQAAPTAEARPAAYDDVFDLQAAEPAPAPHAPVEAAPGTWSPVPVPRPTYAMKARAEPRYTADGIPADVFETPEFAEEADELDERAIFSRRAASQ